MTEATLWRLDAGLDHLAQFPILDHLPNGVTDERDGQIPDELRHDLDQNGALHEGSRPHADVSSYSGLSAHHRYQARKISLEYMASMLAHPGQVSYTEGANRWDPINHGLTLRHLFPFKSDCSGTYTFLARRVMFDVHPGMKDIVNGLAWKAGNTTSMMEHGREVHSDFEVMDAILYAPAPSLGFDFWHTAVYTGAEAAFSHGSMAGPFHLKWDYRPIHSVLRYF